MGYEFGCDQRYLGAHSRLLLSPRHDSGRNMSLYELGEFLPVVDKDQFSLRRRLSSIDNTGSKSESESLKPQVYNLQDILAAFKDLNRKNQRRALI